MRDNDSMSTGKYLALEEGVFLVRLARRTIENRLRGSGFPSLDEAKLPGRLREKRGVFTTLYKLVNDKRVLRGCIGYPLPIKPLYLAVMETAIESAFNDPRFNPLGRDEVGELIIEVSVLTPLEKIEYKSPLEIPSRIKIGRDGLLLRFGVYSGLLLPQVPVEYGWSVDEYLSHLAMKAGLPPDGYLYRGVEIYRFEAQIFVELSPNGDVAEENLGSCRV
jgi:hypothetical protein